MVSPLPISVIMPTYNRAVLISRAITSCLTQLGEGDELIIVDDGSTDETEEIVSTYGKYVKYIKTKNRGAGAARNTGVKESKNPLIAFLDSDDIWLPGKTKIQRAFMQAKPNHSFCFSNFSFKEHDSVGGKEKRFNLVSWSKDHRSWGEILGQGKPISHLIPFLSGDEDFCYYEGNMYLLELKANYINVNTLIVRRDVAEDSLHFAEDTSTYEDWECFGRLSRTGQCAYLDVETACQFSHGGPRLTDAQVTDCAKARLTIMERIWGEDEDFLKNHEKLYRNILEEQRLILSEGLIVRGQTKEARNLLNKLSDPPLFYRLLASLPGILVKALLSIRRYFKRVR